MTPKERRKFLRVASDNLQLNIALKKGDTQSVPQVECRVVNFSLTGLQIETKYPIESEHVHLGDKNSPKNCDHFVTTIPENIKNHPAIKYVKMAEYLLFTYIFLSNYIV